MSTAMAPIVVAGHICLDVIPEFQAVPAKLDDLLAPGTLVEVGPSTIATGGAVSNTGLALHRLGMPVRLMGKVGEDLFGHEVLSLLRRHNGALADGMLVIPGDHTSYTVVLSPPGVDRIFLHHTGANSTFCAEDVPISALEGARFFHFGYPPLMRRMYLGGGSEMASLFEHARTAGLFTSLDMAMPDPASEAGRADWPGWLSRVLPYVDLFAPSLDEILFMLNRTPGDPHEPALYGDVAGELLALGAGMVALKLGERGLYLRTPSSLDRRGQWLAPEWQDRELLAPCFRVEVAGTTGAGDSTVAGMLAGLALGASPEETITIATAVGAFCVEKPDSTSGVPPLEAVQRRIAAGWPRRDAPGLTEGWNRNANSGIWHGPSDHPGRSGSA